MRLAILNAYHYDLTPGNYQEQYMPMLEKILGEQWPTARITEFKVAQGQFPDEDDESDAYLITGSPMSAYDQDEWVQKLKDFVVYCHGQKKKLVGLCFGHQIVAQALGGQVEKSSKGWGVGVRTFDIVESRKWMKPKLKKCSLLFSHQDQVIELPPEALHLAGDDFCPQQMFSIEKHIFCLQGHPEFTPDYARQRLDTRIDKVGRERYEAALETLSEPTNDSEVWQWIQKFCQ